MKAVFVHATQRPLSAAFEPAADALAAGQLHGHVYVSVSGIENDRTLA